MIAHVMQVTNSMSYISLVLTDNGYPAKTCKT